MANDVKLTGVAFVSLVLLLSGFCHEWQVYDNLFCHLLTSASLYVALYVPLSLSIVGRFRPLVALSDILQHFH